MVQIDASYDGKRFIVREDEKLTALVKLESAIQDCGFLLDQLA
jgi:hypothetical protein